MDDDGYLSVVERFWQIQSSQASQFFKPDDLCGTSSFVLLGEPGSGKTTVLNALADNWRHALGQDAVTHLNAIGLTHERYSATVAEIFKALPPRPQAEPVADQVPPARILIIDQLDECPVLGQLPILLNEDLTGKDTSWLRVVLACRLMDYRPQLDDALHALLRYKTTDLAPLTRSQAIQIADAQGVNGVDLVAAAVNRGVSPLAGIPLTLLLLCEMFAADGDLIGSPVAIFERAVIQFAERRSSGGDSGTWIDAVGRDQRLVVSMRIAARLLLSGRRNIFLGEHLGSRRTDLEVAGLPGGSEGAEDSSFAVTDSLVGDTLQCALFAAAGSDRLSFRHSSMAAFLAAKYLISRSVPSEQLRSLFLVEQSVGTTWYSIPPSLREMAAWLVTLNPAYAQCLVDADPLSLASHSAVVDSDEVRSALVAALIRSASETFVSEFWWRRRRAIRLKHPGLATQVLSGLSAPSSSDWQSMARTRLLLELAEEAADPMLTDALVDILTSDERDATDRRLAAEAAMACSPSSVNAVKATALRLADRHYASLADPDDELKGSLLSMLWPDHLTTAELLQLATPRQQSSLYGVYMLFLTRRAAETASDDQVLELLAGLAAAGASESGDDARKESSGPTDVEEPQGPVSYIAQDSPVDVDFVESLIERSFAGAHAVRAAHIVAPLLFSRLRSWSDVEIPAALDETRSDRPPDEVALLRRTLTTALVDLCDDPDADLSAYQIVSAWKPGGHRHLIGEDPAANPRRTLLDAADFAWAVARAQEYHLLERREAAVFAEIAGWLIDPSDPEAYELAYAIYDSEPFTGGRLAALFTAFSIDSPIAEAWRRNHIQRENTGWEYAAEFVEGLNELLAGALRGDAEAFWRLIWELQFDPETGRGQVPRHDDDVRTFPAVVVLGEAGSQQLAEAARNYLTSEDDHRRDWLGTDRYDKRAWAGYLALSLLDRLQESMDDVPWSRWIGGVIWFLPQGHDDDRQRHERLLKRAAAEAPTDFATALALFVTRELGRGHLPYGLEDLRGCMSPELGTALMQLLASIRSALGGNTTDDLSLPDEGAVRDYAIQVWTTMSTLALEMSVPGAEEEIRSALMISPHDALSPLATSAAAVLMGYVPQRAWPLIRELVGTDSTSAMPFALAIGGDRHHGVNLSALSEDYLAELYEWFRLLLPPEADQVRAGAHFVTPEEDARRFRDRILEALVQRSTARALEVLLALSRTHPDSAGLHAALRRARVELAEAMWDPPHPEDIVVLLADATRRLVRSDAELATLVVETLHAVEADLQAHGELLWDRIPATVRTQAEMRGLKLGYANSNSSDDLWAPKPEAALAAYLRNQLMLRLAHRRVVVNREVLVLPRSAYGTGDRADLLVQVVERGSQQRQWSVPVEVKGSWNPDLGNAQVDQLALRYLPEARADAGVYVVGWYPIDKWTLKERRRRAAARRSVPDLRTLFQQQADDVLNTTGSVLRPHILTVPRPSPAT